MYRISTCKDFLHVQKEDEKGTISGIAGVEPMPEPSQIKFNLEWKFISDMI